MSGTTPPASVVHLSLLGALYQLTVPLPDKLPDLILLSSQVILYLCREKVGIIPVNEGNSNFLIFMEHDDRENAAF
ncbi:MAG: hypothetical protein SO355_08550 [Candidatus Faecousia sp.]|nr:hypothetical protein [Candidatus Faecousia sp.]